MKKLSNIVLLMALVLTFACPACAHVVGDINADAEVIPGQETTADQPSEPKQTEEQPTEGAQKQPTEDKPAAEAQQEQPTEDKPAAEAQQEQPTEDKPAAEAQQEQTTEDKPIAETVQEQPTEEAPNQPVSEPTQPVESTPEIDPAALLPDGTANVVDYAVSESGKEFYIIQTANGNTFYLVLDKDRESNNVYLLSPVDEGDLSDFVKQDETQEPTAEPAPVQPEPNQPATPDDPMPSGVSYGSWASLAVIVVAGVGAWYYLNKVKPKREQAKQQKKLDEMEFEDDSPPVNEDDQKPQMYVEDEVDDTPFYLLGRTIQVHYSKASGTWAVSGKNADSFRNVYANKVYGTEHVNGYRLLEDCLNLRDTRILKKVYIDGQERTEVDTKATMLAQQKQDAIREQFKDWVFRDPQRRAVLVKEYNERFNSIRPRQYNGRHVRFDGMNPEIQLREHQLNAVAHVLYGPNTLLAHCVGAGKTFEMAAAAMESKRLGLCQKSLFVVPNHLVDVRCS